MIGSSRTAGIFAVVCWALVLVCALATVYLRHATRNEFVQYQQLLTERDRLLTEWGRLRLEQSTWATHARVEQVAHRELQMVTPKSEDIAVIWP